MRLKVCLCNLIIAVVRVATKSPSQVTQNQRSLHPFGAAASLLLLTFAVDAANGVSSYRLLTERKEALLRGHFSRMSNFTARQKDKVH